MNTPRIYRIGSATDNDWVITKKGVLSYHAELFVDPSFNVFFSPLHAEGICLINGVVVKEPALLTSGMLVQLGTELVDWENELFGKKPLSQIHSTNNILQDSNKAARKKENLELIIIYALIVLFILILLLV